ncbi:MAG TPA: DUF4126 domain-containing protein, partial [Gemmatimonadales bacterium]
METLTTLVQSLGVAYASGISPYATVALLGVATRLGWVGPLPGELGVVGNPVVIAVAALLWAIEFAATLVPWLASAWETVHSIVRPPAAALLAVLTVWQGDPAIAVVAGLLGGGLGLATHATKLGVRVAIDTSPEPVTNGAANVAEMGIVAGLAYFVWQHPYVVLAIALLVLVLVMVLVGAAWRLIFRALRARRPVGREQRGGGARA